MSVLTFIVHWKIQTWTEPNRNLGKTNRSRTVSSEPRVTNISVNRGSPRRNCCSLPAVTSSVIYYSTHTRVNVIYLFYSINIQMAYWSIFGAWKKKNKPADVIWRRSVWCVCVLRGQQPIKMPTEVTLLYNMEYTVHALSQFQATLLDNINRINH